MLALYSKAVRVADLDPLQQLVVLALVKAERYLCCTELDIKLHELLHLPERIKHLGPLWTTAMWPFDSKFEAMWKKLM